MAVSEEDLFAAALTLPATEWSGYLDRVCGEDRALQARLRSLLNAFEGARQFVKEPAAPNDPECSGIEIGPYKLLEPLGEGGCGIVYRAEQFTPVQREVALKIIKLGMDTRSVLARFQTELQVLALMDHPNIARVFDAGATPAGRPYFVMELVRGISITQYCDQRRLSIAERLMLFIQVCHAIQHAHHQGIIHRDIKPSNVLVTLHEGEPHVKVIDFGIAKATQGNLSGQTSLTLMEHFIGTPAYVSPEQIEPGGRQVDARSDLYGLGVLLYELLTGCTPFETEELLGAGLDRMKQRIREKEPPRPSRRLSTLPDQRIAFTAENCRSHSAARIIKQLRGDLDWIVMRCLEKDCTRRYPSAYELAADLRRHLQHEPVSARPATLRYTLGKWTRRHRLIVASTALILAVLLIATLVSATLAIRATHAEQRSLQAKQQAEQGRASAEQASQFMLELVSSADPFVSFGKDLTGRELLKRAERHLHEHPDQPPEIRSQLLQAIGRAYRRLGQPKQSLVYLQDALRTRQQSGIVDDTQMGALLTELAISFRDIGELNDADRTLKRAIEISEHSTSAKINLRARLLVELGRLELHRGNVEKAEGYLTQGLALTRKQEIRLNLRAAEILMDLSNVYAWRDDLDAAKHAIEEATSIYHEAAPENHPDRIKADYIWGQILFFRGELSDAAPLLENVLTKERMLYGNDSTYVSNTLDALANVRLAQNRISEAHELSAEAVEIAKSSGESSYLTALFQSSFAKILVQEKQFELAETHLRQALELSTNSLPPDHQYIASAEYALGELFLVTGRLPDAEKIFMASMNRWTRNHSSAWRIARSASALGQAIYKQGRIKEAENYLVDGYRTINADSNVDKQTKSQALERVTRYYIDQGQPHKLDELLLAGRTVLTQEVARSK